MIALVSAVVFTIVLLLKLTIGYIVKPRKPELTIIYTVLFKNKE